MMLARLSKLGLSEEEYEDYIRYKKESLQCHVPLKKLRALMVAINKADFKENFGMVDEEYEEYEKRFGLVEEKRRVIYGDPETRSIEFYLQKIGNRNFEGFGRSGGFGGNKTKYGLSGGGRATFGVSFRPKSKRKAKFEISKSGRQKKENPLQRSNPFKKGFFDVPQNSRVEPKASKITKKPKFSNVNISPLSKRFGQKDTSRDNSRPNEVDSNNRSMRQSSRSLPKIKNKNFVPKLINRKNNPPDVSPARSNHQWGSFVTPFTPGSAYMRGTFMNQVPQDITKRSNFWPQNTTNPTSPNQFNAVNHPNKPSHPQNLSGSQIGRRPLQGPQNENQYSRELNRSVGSYSRPKSIIYTSRRDLSYSQRGSGRPSRTSSMMVKNHIRGPKNMGPDHSLIGNGRNQPWRFVPVTSRAINSSDVSGSSGRVRRAPNMVVQRVASPVAYMSPPVAGRGPSGMALSNIDALFNATTKADSKAGLGGNGANEALSGSFRHEKRPPRPSKSIPRARIVQGVSKAPQTIPGLRKDHNEGSFPQIHLVDKSDASKTPNSPKKSQNGQNQIQAEDDLSRPIEIDIESRFDDLTGLRYSRSKGSRVNGSDVNNSYSGAQPSSNLAESHFTKMRYKGDSTMKLGTAGHLVDHQKSRTSSKKGLKSKSENNRKNDVFDILTTDHKRSGKLSKEEVQDMLKIGGEGPQNQQKVELHRSSIGRNFRARDPLEDDFGDLRLSKEPREGEAITKESLQTKPKHKNSKNRNSRNSRKNAPEPVEAASQPYTDHGAGKTSLQTNPDYSNHRSNTNFKEAMTDFSKSGNKATIPKNYDKNGSSVKSTLEYHNGIGGMVRGGRGRQRKASSVRLTPQNKETFKGVSGGNEAQTEDGRGVCGTGEASRGGFEGDSQVFVKLDKGRDRGDWKGDKGVSAAETRLVKAEKGRKHRRELSRRCISKKGSDKFVFVAKLGN